MAKDDEVKGGEQPQVENEEQVLVVEDRSKLAIGNEIGDIKMVRDVDEKGNVKTLEPKKENIGKAKTFTMDKRDNILEVFMKNFNNNFKNARNLRVYVVPAKWAQDGFAQLKEMIANPLEFKQQLAEARVNAFQYREKQTVTPDLEEQLKAIGLSKEILEKNGQLEKFLKYQYTDKLRLTMPIGAQGKSTYPEARIALRTQPDGTLGIDIRNVKLKPDFEHKFMGYEFSAMDKANIQNNGNLGKLVELSNKDGEKFNAYVSVDRQTNEFVYVPAKDIRIPESIKDKKLTAEQQRALQEGKIVTIDGFKSKTGTTYSMSVQVNAEKRGLDFVLPYRNPMSLNLNQNAEGLPMVIGGQELTAKQQQKLASGGEIYMKNLVSQKDGSIYNSWITFNKQTGKLSFSKYSRYRNVPSDLSEKMAKAAPALDAMKQSQGQKSEVKHTEQKQKSQGL